MIVPLCEEISFCDSYDPIEFPEECVLLWKIGEDFAYFLLSCVVFFIYQVYKCIVIQKSQW